MTIESVEPVFGLSQKVEQSIRDIDIPPCPSVIASIREEMAAPLPNLLRISREIGKDVALAATLIKLTNSPYFGFRNRVRTLQDALQLIGLDTASQVLAAIFLRRAFPDAERYERFWDASAKIAMLSGWLTQQLDKPGIRASEAYTFGLFRDCGIVILLRRFPGYAETLVEANHECSRSFTKVERERTPVDHAAVGYVLARSWWLPDDTALALRHHHDLAAILKPAQLLPRAGQRLIAVAQTAEYLLQQITGLSQTAEWDKLGLACIAVLGLDNEDLPELGERAAAFMLAGENGAL